VSISIDAPILAKKAIVSVSNPIIGVEISSFVENDNTVEKRTLGHLEASTLGQ